MTVHYLKCHPEPFLELWEHRKRHELRRFDRDYKVGDELRLHEYAGGRFTGRVVRARVTHITAPGTWGLPAGLGVMSIHLQEVRQLSPEKAASQCLLNQPPAAPRHLGISGVCAPGCPACAVGDG